MLADSFAEWILRRSTDRDKAASIVGDLLESDKGRLWFWLAIAGTAFRLSWRRPAAILASVFVTKMLFLPFVKIFLSHLSSEEITWRFFMGNMASVLVGLCAFALVYSSATRRMALPTAICAVFPAISAFFWTRPTVLLADAVCAAAVICGLTLFYRWRAPLAVLLGIVASNVSNLIQGLIMVRIVSHGQAVSQAFLGSWQLAWIRFGLSLIALLITTSLWARLCRWTTRTEAPVS